MGYGFNHTAYHFEQLDEKPVSLPAQGIEQLFPSAPANSEASGTQSEWTLDRASELKKLAKSLLLNFLELVGVLSVNPEQYGRKIEDLRTLFVNTHHLLNEYRPHQARETLIFMMEQQLARSRAETEGIRNMKEKVDGILKGLGEQIDGLQGQEEVAKTKETNPEKNDSDHTRLVWEALEDELVEDEGDLQMS
jgi:mediator of RNA polymerase II transcription subunit 7